MSCDQAVSWMWSRSESWGRGLAVGASVLHPMRLDGLFRRQGKSAFGRVFRKGPKRGGLGRSGWSSDADSPAGHCASRLQLGWCERLSEQSSRGRPTVAVRALEPGATWVCAACGRSSRRFLVATVCARCAGRAEFRRPVMPASLFMQVKALLCDGCGRAGRDCAPCSNSRLLE